MKGGGGSAGESQAGTSGYGESKSGLIGNHRPFSVLHQAAAQFDVSWCFPEDFTGRLNHRP
jgi:hypothetical protein